MSFLRLIIIIAILVLSYKLILPFNAPKSETPSLSISTDSQGNLNTETKEQSSNNSENDHFIQHDFSDNYLKSLDIYSL
ncbi:hypothetical protein [Psychrobacter sp. I-STPA6b]|uniref:hypothetical protein n=1 Tax=Psychrobacter sp. I-STPA6b TaxID=2585718 RepID=UPI001D0CA6CD|nr:hypothetical protein [Psychrobacter sp. I-STPA6b]